MVKFQNYEEWLVNWYIHLKEDFDGWDFSLYETIYKDYPPGTLTFWWFFRGYELTKPGE